MHAILVSDVRRLRGKKPINDVKFVENGKRCMALVYWMCASYDRDVSSQFRLFRIKTSQNIWLTHHENNFR